MLDIQSGVAGAVLCGVLHPVWVSMRLSALASRKVLVFDATSGPYEMVFSRELPQETFKSLHNVFFFSREQMKNELSRFALVRFVLFMICTVIAISEFVPLAMAVPATQHWPVVNLAIILNAIKSMLSLCEKQELCYSLSAVLLGFTPAFQCVLTGILVMFFSLRARTCFALWQQGRRDLWQVRMETQSDKEVWAAYMRWCRAPESDQAPFLEALLLPQRLFATPVH